MFAFVFIYSSVHSQEDGGRGEREKVQGRSQESRVDGEEPKLEVAIKVDCTDEDDEEDELYSHNILTWDQPRRSVNNRCHFTSSDINIYSHSPLSPPSEMCS